MRDREYDLFPHGGDAPGNRKSGAVPWPGSLTRGAVEEGSATGTEARQPVEWGEHTRLAGHLDPPGTEGQEKMRGTPPPRASFTACEERPDRGRRRPHHDENGEADGEQQ